MGKDLPPEELRICPRLMGGHTQSHDQTDSPHNAQGAVKAGSARKSVCVRAEASDNARTKKCGVAQHLLCVLCSLASGSACGAKP